MKLRKADTQDLARVASWFHSQAEATNWGGPRVSYPIELDNLVREIDWAGSEAHVLEDNGELLGFIQVMDNDGFNHICRVAIAPHRRGEGLGETLMKAYLEGTGAEGRKFSLRVYQNNLPAVNLYRKLGFRVAEEDRPPGNGGLLMTKIVDI